MPCTLSEHFYQTTNDKILGSGQEKFCETLRTSVNSVDEWPESAQSIFQGMRSPKGEDLILDRNFFIERILPSSILREMDEEAMDVYRQSFLEAGEARCSTKGLHFIQDDSPHEIGEEIADFVRKNL